MRRSAITTPRGAFVVLVPETPEEYAAGVIPFGPHTAMLFRLCSSVTLQGTGWPLVVAFVAQEAGAPGALGTVLELQRAEAFDPRAVYLRGKIPHGCGLHTLELPPEWAQLVEVGDRLVLP